VDAAVNRIPPASKGGIYVVMKINYLKPVNKMLLNKTALFIATRSHGREEKEAKRNL
jgi:hypothetical protein